MQVFQIICMYVNIWEELGQKWWRVNSFNLSPVFFLFVGCYLNLTLVVKTTIIVLFCPAWNKFLFFWLTGVKCGYIISNQTNQDKAEVFPENKKVGKKITDNCLSMPVKTRYIFQVKRFLLSLSDQNIDSGTSNDYITIYGWHCLLLGLLSGENGFYQSYAFKRHEYFN